ncbi:hypothetical protein M0R88_16890 [Halorussus gelatinilyticus]|uniref:Uncharacterized protein n=1 Tax=Halorussus gelatinilyticus TaxID=2937524 RepID=A0A8U0IGH4_9EURY|nr:hypothetical protein [Halorussus gelatinilyticus]UPW00177.1 hypothetical protein M0R88_16890 [Halorussus gelatinilyticus]
MNRAVPAAFAVLGVLLGAVTRLASVAPALVPDPAPGPPSAVVFLFGTVTFLLSTVAVAGLGYWANRHVAMPEQFARFAVTVGVAGGVGFVVGGMAVLATVPISMDGIWATVVFGLGYNAVTKSVSVGLYALAGAAVAHFRGPANARR